MSPVVSMPNQFRLVHLYEQFNKLGLPMPVLALDADLNFFPAMSTATTEEDKRVFHEFYERTEQGYFFITGRSSDSMEETLGRPIVGAFEHGSAVRLHEGGDVISLVKKVDTNEMARIARRIITQELSEDIIISDDPQAVWDNDGISSVVFPEVKPHALAMVHSQGHSLVEYHRTVFAEAARHIIHEMGLSNTHKVAFGGDAIEVVSRRLTEEAAIYLRGTGQVSDATLAKFQGDEGVGKAQALHLFMGLDRYHNSGRLPFGWGDSIKQNGTDGIMMVACSEYRNGSCRGGGIGTLNGLPISGIAPKFAAVMNHRILPDWQGNIGQVKKALTYLKEQQKVYRSADVPVNGSIPGAAPVSSTRSPV